VSNFQVIITLNGLDSQGLEGGGGGLHKSTCTEASPRGRWVYIRVKGRLWKSKGVRKGGMGADLAASH